MNFYDLESELKFGEYQGKTLEEVVKINPNYIEKCVFEEKNFFISAPVIEDLKKLNPELDLSAKAIELLESKRLSWVQEMGLEEDEGEEAYAYFDEETWRQEFGMPDDDDDEASMETLGLETSGSEQELNPDLERANFAPPASDEDFDIFTDLDDFPYEGPTGEEEEDWDD